MVTILAAQALQKVEAFPCTLAAEADPKILQSRPGSKRKTFRPIVTAGEEWHRVKTEYDPAGYECPFNTISPLDWELAHGNMHNTVPELDEIATLQRLPLQNKCAARPPRVLPKQKTPSQLPRVGHAEDLFDRKDEGESHFDFDPLQHGDHVRMRLRELKGSKRSRLKKWKLSPTQILEEIELWFVSVQSDISAAKLWIKNGKRGPFKPRTKTWIIPQLAMAKWSRGVIWWTQEWFAAPVPERKSIQVLPQDFSITAPNPWNTELMKQWFKDSGCEDEACMQDLHEVGVFLPFTGTMDTVLAPPAVGMYGKLEVAQEVTYEEIDTGMLSPPIMGLHTIPGKLSGRNVARVFRNGKLKDRGTANLSGPNKTSLEHHSVNSGYDLKGNLIAFPPREYTNPTLISFLLAIVAPLCGGFFVLCKNGERRPLIQVAEQS